MAIEDILDALDKQTEIEVHQIMVDARAEAERILAGADQLQAEAEAQAVAEAQMQAQAQAEAQEQAQDEAQAQADAKEGLNPYYDEVVKEAKAEVERELNAEEADYRRQVADVRSEVFEEVFTKAKLQLRNIRSSEGYPEWFSRLVDDASTGMGDNYVLHIDPRDAELAAQVRPGVRCVPDIKTAGGVVVSSADGRITRSSTFEDRLKRVKEDHVSFVTKALAA